MEFFKILTLFYGTYIIVSSIIAWRQIKFILKARLEKPIILDTKGYEVAANYGIAKEKMTLISLLIDWVMFGVWMGGGFIALLSLTQGFDPQMQAVIAVLLFLGINHVVGLPLEWYKKFVVEDSFGFNRSTPKLFMIDQLKGIVLGGVIGGVIVWVIAWVITTLSSWWLIAFLLLFGVIALISILYPTVIAPMFNTFSPLEEGELKNRISKLLESYEYDTNGVFVVDASKRDARLNAYFGGLGKAKRVALFDTLIEKLSHDEIEAVLAHELGHATHGDIYKQLLMSGVMLFVFFVFFGLVSPLMAHSVMGSASPVSIMLVSLLAMAPLSFFVMPLVSFVSRTNEFAADAFASNEGNRGQYLISALEKLVTENKAFPRSDRWTQVFYHTHPTVVERIEKLRAKS